MNKIIFRCKFGSHLYGTNTENSDMDYKSVFIPDRDDLILQKAAKHLQLNTKKGSEERNSKDDIDDESFSVQTFLKLLCEGQTVALDMLFCPDDLVLEESYEWKWLKEHKDYFIHKGTSAFVGYTRTQAAKYGVKGFRVAALREILKWLKPLKYNEKLLDVLPIWDLPQNENIKITPIKNKKGEFENYLEVCDRKVPLTATVKYAEDVYQKIFDMYGERALKAEKNEGIDWKALSHAVRVAGEAIELLRTGKITFPRPDKELLLAIKTGSMDYKEVEKIIEKGLADLEIAQSDSKLRMTPDWQMANSLVYELHLKAILG